MGIGEQNGKFERLGERTNAIISFFLEQDYLYLGGGGGGKGTGTPLPGRALYRKLPEKHK